MHGSYCKSQRSYSKASAQAVFFFIKTIKIMKIKSPEPNVFEIAFFHIKFSYSNDHCLKYLYLNFKTFLWQSIFHSFWTFHEFVYKIFIRSFIITYKYGVSRQSNKEQWISRLLHKRPSQHFLLLIHLVYLMRQKWNFLQ